MNTDDQMINEQKFSSLMQELEELKLDKKIEDRPDKRSIITRRIDEIKQQLQDDYGILYNEE